ncbi:MAG: hypothetical protein R6W77_04270 [Trueperaceae bacterium]
MAHEYRYPLTRVCLRGGALTLPRTMLGLFPDEGEVVAVDTERDTEYVLEVRGPRSVTGLSELFRAHRLDVNDELIIRRLDDGRYAITPVVRPRAAERGGSEALEVVLDELHEAGVPATEAEIRALFPDMPEDVELEPALRADGRFVQRDGRWQPASRAAAQTGAEVTQQVEPSLEARLEEGDAAEMAHVGAEAQSRPGASEADGNAARDAGSVPAGNDARAGSGGAAPAGVTGGQFGEVADGTVSGQGDRAVQAMYGAAAGASSGSAGATGADVIRDGVQAGLWSKTPDGGTADDAARARGSSVVERRIPPTAGRASRIGADDDEDEAAFAASELVSRLRAVVTPIGFRVEPLGRGVLHLHADMGRRGYGVLAQVLPSGERLDWAALLARRRASTMRYLAVFGDHRDLVRLTNPAELARATLWSWEGLERLREMRRTVAVSPVDLESHFERDGLFDHGLARFEQAVAERVAERGAVSEVFTRLAGMRAPTVFLLEELASDAAMSREQTLRILERLADAPFHLVARVDQGEFLLRQRVSDALQGLSDYALSLRSRLPSRQRERLTGLGEPDLLTDADAVAVAGATRDAGEEVHAEAADPGSGRPGGENGGDVG